MSNQDLFVFDLLQRCAEIQRSITVTADTGPVYAVKFAIPRWWEPIGNNHFPGFFNRAKRLSSTPAGRPLRKDVFEVTMRLVIGPAFAGYQGEYENTGNMLYVATINAFDRQQRLAAPQDPPNNLPLQFVEAARILTGDNGIEGRIYNKNEVYMCLDIALEVTATFQVYRQS